MTPGWLSSVLVGAILGATVLFATSPVQATPTTWDALNHRVHEVRREVSDLLSRELAAREELYALPVGHADGIALEETIERLSAERHEAKRRLDQARRELLRFESRALAEEDTGVGGRETHWIFGLGILASLFLAGGWFVGRVNGQAKGAKLRPGDPVSYRGQLGWVESVGFRSTRIRTVEGDRRVIPRSEAEDLSPLAGEAETISVLTVVPYSESVDEAMESFGSAVDRLREHSELGCHVLGGDSIVVERFDRHGAWIRIALDVEPAAARNLEGELRSLVEVRSELDTPDGEES